MSKSISLGLGKATLRGLRRCQKCGTLNGTRGFACKNKSCNVIFKEFSGKKKCFTDACQLDTGTSTRVYSVRVRDKGPDYRGFVQLPAVPVSLQEKLDIIHSTALCFVDKCEGNFNTKVLQCHESKIEDTSSPCNHINAALHCSSNATALTLNTTVLDALSIDPNVKEEVWQLLSESVGPPVQRVSRSIMAVKCQANSKSPLGYLHVSFKFGRTDQDVQFSCPCINVKENLMSRQNSIRCPHFYACICAFVNQDALRDEFYNFIRLEVALDVPEKDEDVPPDPPCVTDADSELASLLESNGCHVEVLQDDVCTILSQTITEDVTSILSDSVAEDAVAFSAVDDLNSQQTVDPMKQSSLDGEQRLRFQLEDSDIGDNQLESMDAMDLVPSTSVTSVDLLALDLPSNNSELNKIHQNHVPLVSEFNHIVPYFLETVIEPSLKLSPKRKGGNNRPQLNFLEWLGSVTETINAQMHYQFPGKCKSAVFQVPAKFFEKFRERMYRARRRRFVSSVTTFNRETVPLGTFTKYSWTLASRMHVKAVFDTPTIPLNLVRSFVRNNDGTYDAADQTALTNQLQDKVPLYKTYLRVGLHKGEADPALFQIEWTPDLLPLSHIGELAIRFEYGHVPCHSVNL